MAADSMHWDLEALPGMRAEAHFGDRIVTCFAERARSFHQLFADSVAARGDDEALVCVDQRFTWRQLDTLVGRLAAGLAARGVKPGERVALYLSNRPQFVIALFATQRLGAIAVPVGTREQHDGLTWILRHCGASVLFHDAELSGRVPAGAEVSDLALCISCAPPTMDDGVSPLAAGNAAAAATTEGTSGASGSETLDPHLVDFDDLLAAEPLREAAPVSEEDAAVILYTSGTTGRPKGAMLTHLGIVHSSMHFVHCMGLRADDRSMVSVPASHVTGLIANIASFSAVGGAVVMMPAFKAADFVALMETERITHTLMVPAMYNLALLQPAFAHADLSNWRVGGYGGAPMPVSTIDALAKRLPGLALLNAYGATETTSPVTMMPAGETRAHVDSVGVALPCAQLIVVDDEGREVQRGETGELWISGPMVVRGYWDDPGATSREFTAGWWHSGDLGSVDIDGYVRVFDRKKDMINRGGYKIFSVEVENLIVGMPGVVEAAIVGRPCPVLGERVHAFVHASDPALDEAAIRQWCAERLADYKVPETITFFADPLPRNANGKLLKRVLRELPAP